MLKYLSLAFLMVLIFYSCKHYPDLTSIIPLDKKPIPIDTGKVPIDTASACSPDTTYFANSILPLIQSNCAGPGCHDATSHKEGIKLIDYNSIITSGRVKPFNPPQSKLYIILSGSGEDIMPPPPNQPFTQEQKDLIAKWIQQGALNNHCDACDTSGVSYSLDVSKTLQSNCYSCHSGSSPVGKFVIDNYNAVLQYVQNGKLIGSIKHNSGYLAMPNSNSYLPSCQINKIQAWVNKGAPDN